MSAYAQHRLVINVKRRHLTLLVAALLRSIVVVWTALQASSKRFKKKFFGKNIKSHTFVLLLFVQRYKVCKSIANYHEVHLGPFT